MKAGTGDTEHDPVEALVVLEAVDLLQRQAELGHVYRTREVADRPSDA